MPNDPAAHVPNMPSLHRTLALLGGATSLLATLPLAAQKKEAPEFTKQGIIVPNFDFPAGQERKLGRRAGDAVRDRVEGLVNGKEAQVLSGREMRFRLEQGGFDPDAPLDAGSLRTMIKYLRADEVITGDVLRYAAGTHLRARLVLARDRNLRQLLPVVVAPELDRAADQLAKEVAAARTQLVPQRRCENALRDGNGSRAIAAARAGIAAYPRSTLARTCLMWALDRTGAPPAAQLEVAREILAIDSASTHALEGAAVALARLDRPAEAAGYWLRLAATDTNDLELLARVITAIAEIGQSPRAVPLALPAIAKYPSNVELRRLAWRVTWESRNWKEAVRIGELLFGTPEHPGDPEMLADPAFHRRLASAYKANGQPLQAVESAARGVMRFPDDAMLYALYTQFVRAESDSALTRGLALFPRSAELHALRAQDLRARGRTAEALEATRQAVGLDSTFAQGELSIAQGEFELGRPDSALAALHRGLARGGDTAMVAQFALGKGNALYRAANGTRAKRDYELALRFVALADSVRPSGQAKFLLGAVALGTAQATLTEAAKVANAGGPASKEQGCTLAREGAGWLPVAKSALEAGAAVAPDAVGQMTGLVGQLETVAGQQDKVLCGPA
jgi:tetratricopeptide (TPR) repeat protein